jgi:hypothetical protein
VSSDSLYKISPPHTKLLSQSLEAIHAILEQADGFSEYEFHQELTNIELNSAIGSKKILGIQAKLITWSLSFFAAK